MKYYINASNPKPAYLQLYEQLRQDIIEGLYPLGARLPSKRLLAEESGVSVITTEHTYFILAEEGYLENRPRSGYYVIYKQEDFLSGAELPAAHLEPPAEQKRAEYDFPFSVLAKTMRRVLQDYEGRILEKSPNQGCLELQNALIAYLARSRGLSLRAEQIVIGAGAEYLYGLILQLFDRETIFGLEDPAYDQIRRVYEANGVECELLPMGREGIHSAALNGAKATVLHITPFNSYPSGVTAAASKRAEYLQWAAGRDGYIIEDNYDSELTVSTKAEEPLFSRGAGRVLYLNTFSRTIAPSVRVGYLVLPETLLERFQERVGFYSCTVPVFEQLVLAELLNNGDFERHINRVRRKKRKLVI